MSRSSIRSVQGDDIVSVLEKIRKQNLRLVIALAFLINTLDAGVEGIYIQLRTCSEKIVFSDIMQC